MAVVFIHEIRFNLKYNETRFENDFIYVLIMNIPFIIGLICGLPEVKNCKTCNRASIYKKPKETQSSNYWIKVGDDSGLNFVTKFDFFVDTLTFEIKYFDTKKNTLLTLKEWRKRK